MMKKVLWILFSFFIFSSNIWADDVEIELKEIALLADNTQKGYDRDVAQKRYDKILQDEGQPLYYRLKACFGNARLFLESNRNVTIAKKYLSQYFSLCGEYLTEELPLVKLYSNEVDKEGSTLMSTLALRRELVAFLLTDIFIAKTLFKPNSTSLHDKMEQHRRVAFNLCKAQDIAIQRLKKVLGRESIEVQEVMSELGLATTAISEDSAEGRSAYVEKVLYEAYEIKYLLYGEKDEEIVVQKGLLELIDAFIKNKSKNIAISSDEWKMRCAVKYLDNEATLKPSEKIEEEWMNNIRVCDVAALVLDIVLKNKALTIHDQTRIGPISSFYDYRYAFAWRQERLTYWRQWWAKNKDKTFEEMTISIIEDAFEKPLYEMRAEPKAMVMPTELGEVLQKWVGWDFCVTQRYYDNHESMEEIVKDIKGWWVVQKGKKLSVVWESLHKMRNEPKYVKIREDARENRILNDQKYLEARTKDYGTLPKPVLQEFSLITLEAPDEPMTKKNLEKILQRIKDLRLQITATEALRLLDWAEFTYSKALLLFQENTP